MKNLLNKKRECLWLFLLLLGFNLSFTACDDDIHDFSKTTPADEAVSIYIADSVFTYSVGWNADMEYTGIADTVIARFPVYLTEAVENDVVVTLMVDDQLRTNYNTIHDIDYKNIPAADLETRNMTVTIPAGKTRSDSLVTIVCKRALKTFLDTTGYLIPVRIRVYKGGGVKPNYEERHSNLFINVNRINGVYFENPTADLIYAPATGLGVSTGGTFVPLQEVKFNVQAYWSVAANVKIEVKNDLIAAYNADNGTNYQPIPTNKLLQSYDVALTPGVTSVKSFTLDYSGDIPSLNDPRGYLIPLVITSVEGEGISNVTTKSILFVRLNVTFLYAELVADAGTLGTRQPQTNFSVIKVTNANTNANVTITWGNMLDNNRNSFWTYTSAPLNLVIDLGAEIEDITGFVLMGHNNAMYRPTYWTRSFGVAFATEAMDAAGESQSMGTVVNTTQGREYYYVRFGEPITARYIYLNRMTGGGNANYNMYSEFYIYK